MASLDTRICDALRAHLAERGSSGRSFGRDALGDPGFVTSLGKGRRLGLRTADRVLERMGHAPIGPAFRAEVEAFLRLGGSKSYVLGEGAAGDPSFVRRLRQGVSFRLATVDKVRAWMWARAGAAARAGMRDAVRDVPFLAGAQGADALRGPADSVQQGERGMTQPQGMYLRTRAAGAWLGLSHRTLERYRITGDGPEYHRFGSRVLYHRDDLDAWAAKRRVRSTSDDGGEGRRAPTDDDGTEPGGEER